MKSLHDFHIDIDTDIRNHGRSVICVGASCEADEPPFAYTIGNWHRGLPELLPTIIRCNSF
jgi:hypothetical protein